MVNGATVSSRAGSPSTWRNGGRKKVSPRTVTSESGAGAIRGARTGSVGPGVRGGWRRPLAAQPHGQGHARRLHAQGIDDQRAAPKRDLTQRDPQICCRVAVALERLTTQRRGPASAWSRASASSMVSSSTEVSRALPPSRALEREPAVEPPAELRALRAREQRRRVEMVEGGVQRVPPVGEQPGAQRDPAPGDVRRPREVT